MPYNGTFMCPLKVGNGVEFKLTNSLLKSNFNENK